MNRIIFNVLLSGASALAGGIAGFFLCKKLITDDLQQKYVDAVNEEIGRLRRDNEQRDKEKKETKTETKTVYVKEADVKDLTTAIIEEFREEAEAAGVEINPYRAQLIATNLEYYRSMGLDEETIEKKLNSLVASWASPQEDEPDEEEENVYAYAENESYEQELQNEHGYDPPRVISLAEYQDLPPSYYEIMTWHYYEEDDTLVDDGDGIVDDVEKLVGDALLYFGDQAKELSDGDEDCVYVENGRMGWAIEIVRMHGSFSEYMGMR